MVDISNRKKYESNRIRVKLLDEFQKTVLSEYSERFYEVGLRVDDPHIVLVRNSPITVSMLDQWPSLIVIARAGSGVESLSATEATERGIVVLNTPGANAQGVAELTMAALLAFSRNLIPAVCFMEAQGAEKTLENMRAVVKKGRNEFAGFELYGKKIAIIGLGFIGLRFAVICQGFGMIVSGYDNNPTVRARAENEHGILQSDSVEDAVRGVDIISVHVPLDEETEGIIGMNEIQLMNRKNPSKVVLNFARDGVCNEISIFSAIDEGLLSGYVTDFSTPLALRKSMQSDKVIVLPHLGASTSESDGHAQDRAVSATLRFLKKGIVEGGVSLPDCILSDSRGVTRFVVVHRNSQNVLARITALLSLEVRIVSLSSETKNEYSYTVFDFCGSVTPETMEQVRAIEGCCGSRTIIFR